MTDYFKVQALRAMVGDGDSDDVLAAYLGMAGSKIIARAYPYRDDVAEIPVKYESLQLEIAAYLLNKRGAEGQTAHSENGISRTYENADVPDSMLRAVTPYCGVIGRPRPRFEQ